MSEKEILERLRRLESAMQKIHSIPGLQVLPGLDQLGQNTQIAGDLEVTGGLTASGAVSLPGAIYYPLSSPYTSTAWDGDARSTTAKTLIDLSAEFGLPAGITAVCVRVWIRDSGSSGLNNCWIGFSPNDSAFSVPFAVFVNGLPNDYLNGSQGVIPCDANGDIYYQVQASGAGTLDAWVEVWGYYK